LCFARDRHRFQQIDMEAVVLIESIARLPLLWTEAVSWDARSLPLVTLRRLPEERRAGRHRSLWATCRKSQEDPAAGYIDGIFHHLDVHAKWALVAQG
jgi:hypothetical protein